MHTFITHGLQIPIQNFNLIAFINDAIAFENSMGGEGTMSDKIRYIESPKDSYACYLQEYTEEKETHLEKPIWRARIINQNMEKGYYHYFFFSNLVLGEPVTCIDQITFEPNEEFADIECAYGLLVTNTGSTYEFFPASLSLDMGEWIQRMTEESGLEERLVQYIRKYQIKP